MLASEPPVIKPHDLVRTPQGDTGTVLEILPAGVRLVKLLAGRRVRLHVSQLFLVVASIPRPWPRGGRAA